MIANDFAFLGLSQTPDMTKIRAAIVKAQAQQAQQAQPAEGGVPWLWVGLGAVALVGGVVIIRRRRRAAA